MFSNLVFFCFVSFLASCILFFYSISGFHKHVVPTDSIIQIRRIVVRRWNTCKNVWICCFFFRAIENQEIARSENGNDPKNCTALFPINPMDRICIYIYINKTQRKTFHVPIELGRVNVKVNYAIKNCVTRRRLVRTRLNGWHIISLYRRSHRMC